MTKLLITVLMIFSLAACSTPPKVQTDETSDDFLSSNLIKVSQTKRGVEVRLQELLLFETGKSAIKPESSKLLDEAVIVLKKSKRDISVEGHTDNVGTKSLNVKLSAERAEAVKVALVNRGIDPKRLRVAGFDFQQPIADNSTEQGRTKNRRVEILMIDEKLENIGGKTAGSGMTNAASDIFSGIKNFFKGLFQ